MLYNIEYLSVRSCSRGYPLSLLATYSISFAYCALFLAKIPFANCLFHQILLFRLYFKKNKWFGYSPSNSTFTKFKAYFSCNLTNLTINLTFKPMFKLSHLFLDSISWNLKNWQASTEKTKTSISIYLTHFHCLNYSLFYENLQLDKSYFQNTDLCKLLKFV